MTNVIGLSLGADGGPPQGCYRTQVLSDWRGCYWRRDIIGMAGIASDTNPFGPLDLAFGHLVIQTWLDVMWLE